MRVIFLSVFLSLSGVAHAERIVSLNLCTDAYLLRLAPERAVALSPLARDPALSVVAEEARNIPWVRADAEAVLALKPDLVLAGPFGARTTLAALERAGLRVERTALPQNFNAIADETRRLAGLLGVAARGEAMVAQMWRRLGSVHPTRPTRAVFLGARGYVAGPGTLEDAVLRAAGWVNSGAGGRVGLEALAAAPPVLLVTSRAPEFPSLATDFVRHPVLRWIPRRVVSPALLACGGPWTAAVVEGL